MRTTPFESTLVIFSLLCFTFSFEVTAQETVSFNRDIRPILAAKCFACHGPDETHQEAGLRLDMREVAVELKAIVPSSPNESSLVTRIFSDSDDEIMPPPHSGEPLALTQKRMIEKWISEGAVYERHWAFERPVAVEPPQVTNEKWIQNPIDNFVLKEMESRKLSPNVETNRHTLVRRMYLDLIGLPPTIEEADAFVNSVDEKAYEKLVDELLESKHYGERWAQPWLDLARYSDTNGYEKDRERSIWPYRDWVIQALNEDMPYDQFSIQQLAGDMLPDPTPGQLVATGFHRNTMLNEEGGIDPLEYRYLAMVDRVATTGTVWLGLTTGCAQCHTHKYDPISHTEYFKLMALLNNADEPDFLLAEKNRLDEIEKAKRRVARLERELESQFPVPVVDAKETESEKPELSETELVSLRQVNLESELGKWINKKRSEVVSWSVIRPTAMKSNLPKLELLDDGSIFATGDTTKRDVYELTFELKPDQKPITAIRIEAVPDDRLPDGGPGNTYYEGRKGDFFLSELTASLAGKEVLFSGASHTFSKPGETNPKLRADNVFDGDGSSGWSPGKNKSRRLVLVVNLKDPIVEGGRLDVEMLFERHYTVSLGRFRFSTTTKEDAAANRLDEEVENVLAGVPKEKWTEQQQRSVRRAFLLNTPLLAEVRKPLEVAKQQVPKLNHTLVLQERPQDNMRHTFRHHRGEYLDPKEKVEPGIPAILKMDAGGANPANRFEFSQWLVSEENPLAARVAVNRAWREFFGDGLMRTSGDFGVQSQPPSHPELLDWLAVEFREEMAWSMKSLHRLIVTSATYRQSSDADFASVQNDPYNIWLTRGPSYRVSGEMVRDIALKASGSISTKMFGPGVRPPQPASVTGLAYGKTKWDVSTGEDKFRRSIYTFKKRTATFAAFTVFDGPTGEACTARRNRSNTPLQALTVLNDEMYQEYARILAAVIAAKNLDTEEAILLIFRRFLTRHPEESELKTLSAYFADQIPRFESKELSANEVGGENATNEQAALVMVARVVMNLDETITKR